MTTVTPRLAPPPGATTPALEPLYVDAGALLDRNLTGVGRFAARMIEALARRNPVRLFTTLPPGTCPPPHMLAAQDLLYWTEEIALEPVGEGVFPSGGDPDTDMQDWAQRMLRLPRRSMTLRDARKHAAIYCLLRPLHRMFRTELGLFHDFTPLLLPWGHAPETLHHFGALFGLTATQYDWVIANSQSTKSDASWLCDVPEDRVITQYPGPSMCVRHHAHTAPVQRSPRSILAVSALEPRKNGPFLLDWFLKTDVLEPGTELLWAGPKGWWASSKHTDELRRLAEQKTDRSIKLLGFVSDQQLCELYQRAALTVYPSLYEGFGFPVLDSLRHGTPVLSSFHSSLKEFDCPGVYYFDCCDKTSLDEAYLQMRNNQAKLQIDRADLERRFSWDRFAQTVITLAQPSFVPQIG